MSDEPREELSEIKYSQNFDFERMDFVDRFTWVDNGIPAALVSTIWLSGFLGVQSVKFEAGDNLALGDLRLVVKEVNVGDDENRILVERA
jgi:hypothetical protein